jgi:hypothetical protein
VRLDADTKGSARYFYSLNTCSAILLLKVNLYAIVPLWYDFRQLYLDKFHIIMEMLLPDAKKLRKDSENFNFVKYHAVGI